MKNILCHHQRCSENAIEKCEKCKQSYCGSHIDSHFTGQGIDTFEPDREIQLCRNCAVDYWESAVKSFFYALIIIGGAYLLFVGL